MKTFGAPGEFKVNFNDPEVERVRRYIELLWKYSHFGGKLCNGLMFLILFLELI